MTWYLLTDLVSSEGWHTEFTLQHNSHGSDLNP